MLALVAPEKRPPAVALTGANKHRFVRVYWPHQYRHKPALANDHSDVSNALKAIGRVHRIVAAYRCFRGIFYIRSPRFLPKPRSLLFPLQSGLVAHQLSSLKHTRL